VGTSGASETTLLRAKVSAMSEENEAMAAEIKRLKRRRKKAEVHPEHDLPTKHVRSTFTTQTTQTKARSPDQLI
jgi:regulator of replication initiation timing